MQPIDYRINVAQPTAAVLGGVQSALQIAQGMESADAEKARGELYKAQTQGAIADNAAKERAATQAAALQADIGAVLKQPTTEGINSLMLKYPHLSEGFQRGLNAVSAEEQRARIQEGTQVYAAVLNGKPEVGAQILKDTAAALREKGNTKQAETYERMAKLIEINPTGAQTTIGMMLSTAMGPDKFNETFKGLEGERRTREGEPDARRLATATADKAVSDAAAAAVKAKYAESDAALDLQKKGWDITKVQEDIKIAKLNSQIAAGQLAVAREGNALKRDELGLRVAELQRARDKETRERVAEAASAVSTVDNAINQIDAVLNDKNRTNVMGTVEGRLPALLFDSNADSIARIETLGSQVFLAQVKQFGSTAGLTEREGDKLQASLQNLSRTQSVEVFDSNLKEAQRLMLKARANLEARYGVPKSVPDTPAAATPDAVEAALKKYLPQGR